MILDLPGNGGQTKIPTDYCANIFRVAPICPCTARPSLVPSQGSSMKGRERPCAIRRRLRSSLNVLQRSVELAARSSRSGPSRRLKLIPRERTGASRWLFRAGARIDGCTILQNRQQALGFGDFFPRIPKKLRLEATFSAFSPLVRRRRSANRLSDSLGFGFEFQLDRQPV